MSKKNGCIIFGFPGVGKSTIAGWKKCVDLEVTNFRIDGEKKPGWYIQMGQVALDLAKQGFMVFVGTHIEVRNWLKENAVGEVPMVAIYPDKTLKDLWLTKLRKRYEKTLNEKDKRAYERMVEDYDHLVTELKYEGWHVNWTLNGLGYDLKDWIKDMKKKYKW